jgi:predicted DNA-binding transcriptional regulator YafY
MMGEILLHWQMSRIFERLLHIDGLLRDPHRQTASFMAKKLEVSERTIRSDLDMLRDRYHAPIDFNRKQGYHYTDPDWRLLSEKMAQDTQNTKRLWRFGTIVNFSLPIESARSRKAALGVGKNFAARRRYFTHRALRQMLRTDTILQPRWDLDRFFSKFSADLAGFEARIT